MKTKLLIVVAVISSIHGVAAEAPTIKECPDSFAKAWSNRNMRDIAHLPAPPRPCFLQGEHDRYLCQKGGCEAWFGNSTR